jgi:3-phenylpropionate/trans-cinnamate dioxygenase ferredoxin subunit
VAVDVCATLGVASALNNDSTFVTVARLDDLPPGALRCVELDGASVTLANADGSVYAFDAYCSHQRALLEEGDLEGTEVICPWHAAGFDIVTGRVLAAPATEDIETYVVRVDGEDVQLERAPEGGPKSRREIQKAWGARTGGDEHDQPIS